MNDTLKPNSILKAIQPPIGEDSRHPEVAPLLEEAIDSGVLRTLAGQSVLSALQFSREQIRELFKLSAVLQSVEIAPSHPLDGKLVITAFFEASTRTRISFESSVLRLDGKIISIPEANITGVAKGESLVDIGEMFNAYGDLVIMRHRETAALEAIRQRLRVPLVNAGNGAGEHPTQALADWYALVKWKPQLLKERPGNGERKLRIGILGTPGSMRAVKSFLLMATFFHEHIASVSVVSEYSDPLGDELSGVIQSSGIDFVVTHKLNECLPELDVIYMNSIALEGDAYKTMGEDFKLNTESPLKPEAVILHPLARLDELDTSLDETPHNLYFSQAHGAVFVRQALMIALLDRLDRLPDFK